VITFRSNILEVLIFLAAALLGFGNLAGWWDVSWWVVALVWPIAPLVICLLVPLALVLTVLPYCRR
jgi:hypothetical protein